MGPTVSERARPTPGSVIIADSFVPQGAPSHGQLVNSSLRDSGFRGQVFTLAQPGNSGSKTALQRAAYQSLLAPSSSPETLRDALLLESESYGAGLLESQSRLAHTAADSGARNSVLNFSWGTTKARQTEFLYNRAAGAWSTTPMTPEARAESTRFAESYARAFGLDMTRLNHCDPTVYGPERARLQQHLASVVDQAYESPTVRGARRGWDTAVSRFEANNNSVVIAAGNEGEVADRLAADAAGYRIVLPRNFTTSLMENAEVTSVGALADGWSGRPASYSSRSSGIDTFADGNAFHNWDCLSDGQGTSFSAPRVAGGMADLHRLYPHLSSAQIQNLYNNRL